MPAVFQPFHRGTPRSAPKALLLIALALALGATGCNLLKTTLALPEKGIRAILPPQLESKAPDPVELQSELLRFADNAIETLTRTIGKLDIKNNKASREGILLRRRISITNDILAIATGANPYANLIDMAILASLNRLNVEERWIRLYGESAKPYLLASQQVEKEIWRIAGTTLKKSQLTELRAAVKTWHEQHPAARSLSDIGALSFATEVAQLNRESRPGITASVFNLLAIDPLAGLDPATRELANTRLLAERGLFLARHMPTLIRWETELLVVQTSEIPQIEKLLADTALISESADRFSRTAEQLPGLVSDERRQIIRALNEQRPGLISLAAQTEKALNAGKQMSEASTTTLKSFQDVVRQLQAIPENPKAEPFRINDYTAAAAQINDAARDLIKLLKTFDQTLSPDKLGRLSNQLGASIRQAKTGGKELVDYAFRRTLFLGLILIGSACGLLLVSAVVFWKLKKHFA